MHGKYFKERQKHLYGQKNNKDINEETIWHKQ